MRAWEARLPCCLPRSSSQGLSYLPGPRFRRQRSYAGAMAPSASPTLCSTNIPCGPGFDLFSSSMRGDWSASSSSWWRDRWKPPASSRRALVNPKPAGMFLCEPGQHAMFSRWKLLLRKLRAKTRKLNCSRPPPARFQYDAFSYSMNFDDGCWLQHPSRFPHSHSEPFPKEEASASTSR